MRAPAASSAEPTNPARSSPPAARSFRRFNRREQEILIVVTEVRDGRHRFHRDSLHLAVGIQTEGHVSRLNRLVVEAGDEAVVLPMLEYAAHARRRFEVDGEFSLYLRDVYLAVPGIGIGSRVALER